jgi:hypothetical protein
MKTNKIKYFSPLIEKIILDSAISLTMESTPPLGPDELALVDKINPNPDLLRSV